MSLWLIRPRRNSEKAHWASRISVWLFSCFADNVRSYCCLLGQFNLNKGP
jgi:hypothetical protein